MHNIQAGGDFQRAIVNLFSYVTHSCNQSIFNNTLVTDHAEDFILLT